MELIERYVLTERHTLRKVDIYKTEGYIPQFHSKGELKIGATYEIRGYMFEDGYLRVMLMKELESNKSESTIMEE